MSPNPADYNLTGEYDELLAVSWNQTGGNEGVTTFEFFDGSNKIAPPMGRDEARQIADRAFGTDQESTWTGGQVRWFRTLTSN